MSTKHITPAGGNNFADINIPDAENEKLRLSLLAAIREWRLVQKLERVLSSCFTIVVVEHTAKPFAAMNRIIG